MPKVHFNMGEKKKTNGILVRYQSVIDDFNCKCILCYAIKTKIR